MIIVDDGSTDDSLEIARRHTVDEPRVKVLSRSKSPKGACSCRNEGLELAQGEFVIFLDSDDLLNPNCLKERLQRFDKSQENDFIVCFPEIFHKEPGDSEMTWGQVYPGDYLDGFLERAAWITVAVTWRTDWLRKIGGWREGLPSYQDWELHIRALIHEPRFQVFAEARDAYLRRGVETRISGQSEKSNEHLRSRKELIVEIFDQLVASNKLNRKRKQLLAKQLLLIGLLSSLSGDQKNGKECTKQIDTLKLVESPLKMRTIQLYAAFERSKFFRLPVIFKTLRPTVKLLFMAFIPAYVLLRRGS